MSLSIFEAPYPAYDPTDKRGFSYETVVKRWPVILTQVIDQVYRTNHQLSRTEPVSGAEFTLADTQAKIEEGKTIIEKISRLKYQISRDHEMEFIIQDREAHIESYNSELAGLAQHSRNTWFTAPWLFAECYLYRLLRSYFSNTKYWFSYDPFFERKVDAFKKSKTSVYQIATIMHELASCQATITADSGDLGVLFNEIMQICLWGNSADLSFSVDLVPDTGNLQVTGKILQWARNKTILKDDREMVWQSLKCSKDQRIDIVLDNAGFELFTDLVLADFLVTYTPYVSRVVFHPKLIPWFVSDVIPSDFRATITALLDRTFFSSSPALFADNVPALEFLEQMVMRWNQYLEEGTFVLSVPMETKLGDSNCDEHSLAEFWTAPWPYWDMKIRARKLWDWLNGSGLVIFKGDLNYRKLTGDVQWPRVTSFESAIGPLAGSFPIVSLRTNKADVIVGIQKEVADKLDQIEEGWRTNGQYALVSFIPVYQCKDSSLGESK